MDLFRMDGQCPTGFAKIDKPLAGVRGAEGIFCETFCRHLCSPGQGPLIMNAKIKSVEEDAAEAVSACPGSATGSRVATDGTLSGVKSNGIPPKDYATKEREKWLSRLAKEFLRLDGLFPFKDFAPKKNCPEWLGRVEQEYFVAVYRGADLKGATKITPIGMGGFLGYQCAYAVWMMECLDAKIEIETRNAEKYNDVVLTKEKCDEGLKILRRFREWYGALRHLAGRALKSCVYHSYEEMSGFLTAYSRAFNKKPKLGAGMGDFGSTTFGIYHFMLWHWRAVDQLDSVRSLHDLLRRSIGEHRVGDLKRIQKICQRIGLHYRKPGRPKASK